MFDATTERQSMELDHRIRASMDICCLEEEENELTDNGRNYVHVGNCCLSLKTAILLFKLLLDWRVSFMFLNLTEQEDT